MPLASRAYSQNNEQEGKSRPQGAQKYQHPKKKLGFRAPTKLPKTRPPVGVRVVLLGSNSLEERRFRLDLGLDLDLDLGQGKGLASERT